MCYHAPAGRDREQIVELVARVAQVVGPWPATGRPPELGLCRQVVMVLMLLRQNIAQYVAVDIHAISQLSVSRIYRGVWPFIEQVTCLH